jgi:hypothetical protein
MSVPLKTVLINFSAIVALWAPVYLALLEYFGPGDAARSEALQWMLVVVGTTGLGGVLYTAWKDTCDPAWRASHGLPRRTRAAASR